MKVVITLTKDFDNEHNARQARDYVKEAATSRGWVVEVVMRE